MDAGPQDRQAYRVAMPLFYLASSRICRGALYRPGEVGCKLALKVVGTRSDASPVKG
jgi:hypothetical protein